MDRNVLALSHVYDTVCVLLVDLLGQGLVVEHSAGAQELTNDLCNFGFHLTVHLFLACAQCWRSYPYISIESELQWLYLVELSIYCNMCFSQFFDVRRGDFWAMCVSARLNFSSRFS